MSDYWPPTVQCKADLEARHQAEIIEITRIDDDQRAKAYIKFAVPVDDADKFEYHQVLWRSGDWLGRVSSRVQSLHQTTVVCELIKVLNE